MRSVCVFAGSRPGARPDYITSAARLGQTLAERGIQLVYGGSRNGLMGHVADEALRHGGGVVGIMPTGLFTAEIVHRDLSEFIEVHDMHERKATMGKRADGFIALPGGIGTFEELFEVLCWSQIGIHAKPLGLLNVQGYYDPLLALIRHSVQEGFSSPESLDSIYVSDDPAILLHQMLR